MTLKANVHYDGDCRFGDLSFGLAEVNLIRESKVLHLGLRL